MHEDCIGQKVFERLLALEEDCEQPSFSKLNYFTPIQRLQVIGEACKNMQSNLRKANDPKRNPGKSKVAKYFGKLFAYFQLPLRPAITSFKGLMKVQPDIELNSSTFMVKTHEGTGSE